MVERKQVAELSSEQRFSEGEVPLFTVSETLISEYSSGHDRSGCPSSLITSVKHHQFSLSLKLQWQIFRIFVFFVTFDRRKNNASTRHNIQQSGCYIIEIHIRVCELKRKWVNVDTLSYVSSEFLVTIPDHYHFTGHSNDSCPTSLAFCTL